MIIAVGFDGTIVLRGAHADTVSPLRLRRGAIQALRALKKAGHVLVLSSTRANRALRVDPDLDPLVASGVTKIDRHQWQVSRLIHEARYDQMIHFVHEELPGLFAAVDDGKQGPVVADLYIDHRGVRVGDGALGAQSWEEIAATWGAEYPRRTRGA